MRAVGIAVSIRSARPICYLAVLTNATGVPAIEDAVEIPGDAADTATQLHDMAEAVRSRLTGLTTDRVVIRRADHTPIASNRDGPRIRLLTEGAVLSAARGVVVDTRIGTGKHTGAWYGSNKAGVDAAAEALLAADGRAAK